MKLKFNYNRNYDSILFKSVLFLIYTMIYVDEELPLFIPPKREILVQKSTNFFPQKEDRMTSVGSGASIPLETMKHFPPYFRIFFRLLRKISLMTLFQVTFPSKYVFSSTKISYDFF